MNKSIVKVAVALLAVPALAFGAGKSAEAPGQDIHFMKDGQIVRGVRCAVVDPSEAEAARIDAELRAIGAYDLAAASAEAVRHDPRQLARRQRGHDASRPATSPTAMIANQITC